MTPRTLVETETPGWFLDPATNKKARKRDGDAVIAQDEFDKLVSKGTFEPGEGRTIFISETGRPLIGPTTTIQCVDCGKTRVIKVQDKFQVERCAQHQKEHRNELRRLKRAAAKKG